MNKKTFILFSLVAFFGMAALAFSVTSASTLQTETASCCAKKDCCKDGECKMGGECCKGGTCEMKKKDASGVKVSHNHSDGAECCKADTCQMKNKDAKTVKVSGTADSSCCDKPDCCKGGECKMGGECCKNHDSCKMKSKDGADKMKDCPMHKKDAPKSDTK
jgi:hypothetical protein